MKPEVSDAGAAQLPRGTLIMLAVMCGLSIASAYYAQPLLPAIGRAFGIPEASMGIMPMLTQIGIALGVLLFVPLGDIVDERKLILALIGAHVVALALLASSRSTGMLQGSSALLGVTTVTPYLLPAFAAKLTPAGQRGQVTGLLARGIFAGILLARTASGYVGFYLSWSAIYWIASAGVLAMGVMFYRALPGTQPHSQLAYRSLLASLWTVFAQQPALRRATLTQSLIFGAFNAFWVTLAFYLETPRFHMPSYVAGLFGVIGVAGAFVAPIVGKLADRRGVQFAVRLGTGLALLSWVAFALIGNTLAGLVIGVLLLDLGTTASHVSNQTIIYQLGRHISSRVTTLYILGCFVGASVLSSLSTLVWAHWGWHGVCTLGFVVTLAACAVNGLPPYRRALRTGRDMA